MPSSQPPPFTLEGLPPLREVIASHGLAAHKSLGQHFLLDPAITQKIVKLAGPLAGVHVIEVGPGPGGLTRALLASDAASVVAIEKDRRCVAALAELSKKAGGRFQLIEGDALACDPLTLTPAPRAIVANLPYNVGTAMLLNWLAHMDAFESLTLMFQAEVVDRLVATVGSKAYGRLSVLTQFYARAERVMKLPAGSFSPPPKVDSAVVRLTPRADRPRDVEPTALEAVTAAAFGQRRKMLRSSLKPFGGEAFVARAGLDPSRRAEELPLSAFEALARLVSAGNR